MIEAARIAAGRPRWRALAALLLVPLAAGAGAGAATLLGALLSRSARAPAAVVSTHDGLHGEAVWAAGSRPAPAIDTLRDQTGGRFSLADLRGEIVTLAFMDSHCLQTCPLEGRALAAAESSLPRAARPVLVVVSVNHADTAGSVRAAIRRWGLARAGAWHWLMGTPGQLRRVWRAYRIYVSPRPVNGDIAHTEAIYLVDRRGYERSAYLYPFLPRFVADDLHKLAAERKG